MTLVHALLPRRSHPTLFDVTIPPRSNPIPLSRLSHAFYITSRTAGTTTKLTFLFIFLLSLKFLFLSLRPFDLSLEDGDVPESSAPSPASIPMTMMMTSRTVLVREDCWSEDATFTLIEAWEQRYVELNRGNVRQKQWQEVADTVNASHGHVKKARRTDIQCRNRIDTLKKKYKIEKARVLDSNGSYRSPWPFFEPLDELIGHTLPLKKIPPSPSPSISQSQPPMAVPLLSHRTANESAAENAVVPLKRPAGLTTLFRVESGFRRNYLAMAVAAAVEESDDDDDKGENWGGSDAEGIRKLAEFIEKFGELYARVEAEKQRQMIELEKQRMQFAKELECQRIQMLAEMQVQLEKIKRAKRSDSNSEAVI